MSKFQVTSENDEEKYFRWYADELVQYGYLKKYEREPETFMVLPDFKYQRKKRYKVKPDELEEISLLQNITYTYDFRLIWDESALFLFTEILQENGCFEFNNPAFVSHYIELEGKQEIVSYVDIKPTAAAAQFSGQLGSYRSFPFVQKILMHMYSIYINKTVIAKSKKGASTSLFAQTFVPNRFLYTDKAKDLRTIHFNKTSIKSYVKNRQEMIDKWRAVENEKSQKHNQTSFFE